MRRSSLFLPLQNGAAVEGELFLPAMRVCSTVSVVWSERLNTDLLLWVSTVSRVRAARDLRKRVFATPSDVASTGRRRIFCGDAGHTMVEEIDTV